LVHPSSIFHLQLKRFHAYKSQLLNVLHILYFYNPLKEHSTFSFYPPTFIFPPKPSPPYYYPKNIIKLINQLATKLNTHPYLTQYIKIIFLQNYPLSLAQHIFPPPHLSHQIST
ncbi:glycogen/starch/alpha-glucan phosphorylase, partial [Bacillus mycoides]|uniref:glycogen/starch/alpha-glucan phosphorylase n=1 Tax=Bacillus mycoides TaxID=1405 RepID=UPI001642A5AA